MTKSPIIYCFILLVFLYGSAFAGGLMEVELIDGSMVSGEIISFSDGIYTLRSGVLGTVKINESKIKLIRFKSYGGTEGETVRPLNTSVNEELQAIQKSIMNDQNILRMILSLQNDPDIQELLQDSVIMEAVNSGDFSALMSSPKIIKILQKPELQEIQEAVSK